MFRLLWLTAVGAQILPVEYTTKAPVTFPPGFSTWFRFTTCHGSATVSLHVTAQMVLPVAKWNPDTGSYVNYTIYSAEDNCTTPVCSNNIYATDPSVCAFTHTSSQTEFFVNAYAPKFGLPAQVAVFSVRSVPATRVPEVVSEVVPPKPKNAQCPTSAEPLRVFFRNDVTVNNDVYDQWAQFEVPVCTGFDKGFSLTALALDTSSAMATYVCNKSPCTGAAAFAYDLSGSAFNTIFVGTPVTAPTYLAIAGWGPLGGKSTLTFGITPNEGS